MNEKYFPAVIEEKWQQIWEQSKAFEVAPDNARPKFYCLEMLPYPSGNLHMGHVRNYSIGDALGWYKRLQGFNVLHPIGWDSFGQPAEQAAIKRGVNPREWTEENIKYMRGQLKRLGISYDWSREIAAHRPEYYKFDQWFFLKMYERGLAYKKDSLVNWCPFDQTILSNEQASGGVCWRCENPVEKKTIKQWFLKITAYAEQLLDDMSELEAGWPEKVLAMQRNWIGKSDGAFVEFQVDDSKTKDQSPKTIKVFTTRIDTIYGVNAIVLAAEHPLIEAHFADFDDATKRQIEQIRADKLKVTAPDEEVEKIGVGTGLTAINPFSGEEIPIWTANYVLMEYGTGAVMSVPAHDERDFEFAKKYGLPIRAVVNQVSPDVLATVKNRDDAFELNKVLFEAVTKTLVEANQTLDGLNDVTAQARRKQKKIDDKKDLIEYVENLNVCWAMYQKIARRFDDLSNEIDFLIFQIETKSFEELEENVLKVTQTNREIRHRAEATKNDFKDIVDDANKMVEVENRFVEIQPDAAMTEYGVVTDSGDWTGETSHDAKRKMTKFARDNNFGEAATTYRLRDWGISRQRFWGAPIPIVYCESCGAVPVSVEQLPVKLPDNVQITGKGESPLANVPEFVKTTCPNCHEPATRETDTMDTFVDSSWYFYRYLDPHNESLPFESEIAAYWTPVDQYIGGVDHAVMHLLYARFWTKFMRDAGIVKFNEPFTRLLNQGMVVGETFFNEDAAGKRAYFPPSSVNVERDAKGKILSATNQAGEKVDSAVERMSKSKGNGIDPDEMIRDFGADAARIYVLFSAPAENELVWNDAGIEGAIRFLQRVWRAVWRWNERLQMTNFKSQIDEISASTEVKNLRRKTHETIKRVADDFERLQLNTPIAALMELSNQIGDVKTAPADADRDLLFAIGEALQSLVLMLTPFAPHAAEEMFAVLAGNERGILANDARFPVYREDLARKDEIEIPIQVNGKLRSRIFVAPDTSKEDLQAAALADEKTRENIAGKQIIKVVVVPNRLVNVVVK